MARVASSRRPQLLGALLALALLPGLMVLPWAPTVAADGQPTVIGKRVLGRSVQDRKIVAYHLGEPGKKKVVLISLMHGNEPAPRRILLNLIDGPPVHGVDLWVVPVYNPDGLARGTRKNARGIDLNRNFPYRWASVGRGTTTWSGPRPLSEPESRALRAFVLTLRPSMIVIFHQPLFGVGTNEKDMGLVRALAAGMRLPVRQFHCTGICPGSFSSWVNATTASTSVTVEFGRAVSAAQVRRAAATIRSVGRTL